MFVHLQEAMRTNRSLLSNPSILLTYVKRGSGASNYLLIAVVLHLELGGRLSYR
jgi:hypothetical protein